jgi:hypothetical protein
MSEFYVEVVKLGPIERLPNSDKLSITNVMGGYPCIIRTGDFAEGDLAVYISVDALVDTNRPEFKFLASEAKSDGWYRIKAKKLRGTFSMGLLVPVKAGMNEGDKVQKELEVEKYLPLAEQEPKPARGPKKKGTWYTYLWYRIKKLFGFKPPTPPAIPYYDIEGIRKYKNLFQEGEEVYISEKLHGCQGVYTYTGKNFFVRSREVFRYGTGDNWTFIATKYDMKNKLKNHPNKVLFGEVYGAVQDLKYGVPQHESLRFAAFDVLDLTTNTYLPYDEFLSFCKEIDVPVVPELYRGPWNPELVKLAEGKTTMPGADHVREGIVIKPVDGRVDPHFGRVILKLHGEGFLTRKEKN